jgi:hypothetical protein
MLAMAPLKVGLVPLVDDSPRIFNVLYGEFHILQYGWHGASLQWVIVAE